MSGPGGKEGEDFNRVAEIASEMRAVQSAKGQRMEGRGQGDCGGQKWVTTTSLILVEEVASRRVRKPGASRYRDSCLIVQMDHRVAAARRDLQ